MVYHHNCIWYIFTIVYGISSKLFKKTNGRRDKTIDVCIKFTVSKRVSKDIPA